MAKTLLRQSSSELELLPMGRESSVGENSADLDSSLLGDLSADISSAEMDGVSTSASTQDEDKDEHLARLEEENSRLRAHVRLMKRELTRYFGEAGAPESPSPKNGMETNKHRATLRQMAFDSPLPVRKRRMQKRRWSLSSAQDPEIGVYRVNNSENGRGDEAVVVFHDELDQYSSGRSLHHRRGPSLPRPATLKQKRSDSGDVYSATSGDDYFYDENGAEGAILLSDSHDNDATSFWADVKDRAGWLVGLMVLQSLSSFIIKRNEELLAEHIVIVQFLTMLVGAGGNAGNQASVRVIRGLAIGTITDQNLKPFLTHELGMGFTLAIILAISGCIRATVFATPIPETFAITASLWTIVLASVAIGSLLPIGMKRVGIDPAHSSTSIQVIMDILGVTITVHISKLFLSLIFSGKD